MEERRLLGTESGVLRGDDNAEGRDGSRSGGRPHFVLQQFVPHFDQVTPCEDESDVTPDVRQQLLQCGVALYVALDGLSHHGVLTHEHNCVPTEGHADLLHLLGADIVCTHDEAFGVVV